VAFVQQSTSIEELPGFNTGLFGKNGKPMFDLSRARQIWTNDNIVPPPKNRLFFSECDGVAVKCTGKDKKNKLQITMDPTTDRYEQYQQVGLYTLRLKTTLKDYPNVPAQE
jgi:hypothetical protein